MGVGFHGKGARIQDVPFAIRRDVINMQLKQRVTPEQAHSLIEKLCGWQAPSAGEALLQRTQVTVSQAYLSPMVAEGRLTYLYPEMVQHPRQRYLTSATTRPRARTGRRDK